MKHFIGGHMFYTERKLERRIDELSNYRYRDVISFDELYVKEDVEKLVDQRYQQPLAILRQ